MPKVETSKPDDLTPEERALGMGDMQITRRDFCGAALTGAGASLLARSSLAATDRAPTIRIDPAQEAAFNGYPGIGDYARSNGNTWRVVSSAHAMRDGAYDEQALSKAIDTNENTDLAIIGGGPAGLASGYYFQKAREGRGSCVIFDNHPIFGGEAKRNEFEVDGQKLIGPQGSNMLRAPGMPGDGLMYEELLDLGVPLQNEYAALTGTRKQLEFDRTNYIFLWAADHSDSLGYFFDDSAFGHSRHWVTNPWKNRLEGAGISPELRAQLLRWRYEIRAPKPVGPELNRFLDGMTYREYLMNVHHLPLEVANFTEPFVASAVGLGSSVVSAYAVISDLGLPGGLQPDEPVVTSDLHTFFTHSHTPGFPKGSQGFPGGNDALARAFAKRLIPDAIEGSTHFEDVVTKSIRFDALDRRGSATRIRVGATVVDVRHVGAGDTGRIRVTYERGGILYRTDARKAVYAGGGWIARHVVHDLPQPIRSAYGNFKYSSMLVANVALRNWQFLERMGITACVYTGGEFGFSCNIRQPMQVGPYRPPLDPGKPIVLTFYAPVIFPGEEARAQGARARGEILGTLYRDYELRIRRQLTTLFGAAGFDAARDVAGITLNRWGHAYVVPEPGFLLGKNGAQSEPDIIREGYGNIRFASAELRGLQNYKGAVYEAKRAIEQLYGRS